ncbi:uncharacterized protein LOC18008840 [Eutrema salsugineum]|uniref:uncharacterized protein LOC18008840 n=1 Tax=Eutrema salsugineum TaxID=72664 RepID=UPI000CED3840|nr:uncharacterized protein LOC18008840 [Eutrema salsugineum]
MEKFLKRRSPPSNIELDDLSHDPAKRKNIQESNTMEQFLKRRSPPSNIELDDLPHDLAKQKNIQDYHPDQRDEYPDWLEYSMSEEKAFCLFCYLFRVQVGKQSGCDAFVSTGFSSWNKADSFSKLVCDHTSFHSNAKNKCEDLMRQGLSFRAHNEKEVSTNKGNFIELLKLSLKKVRGQGYDGAIGASCKRKVVLTESNRKRMDEGIKNGEIKSGTGLNQDRSLENPGNTRWGSHYKTLLRLVEMFPCIVEFNDRFDEMNSKLLVCMASLSPIDSFRQFDKSKLVRLAELYPDDFSFVERRSLDHQLDIYLDNVQKDDRFTNIVSLGDLARVLVETRKHLSHPLVYRLLKLCLILSVAIATVERCFSAMKIVKIISHNSIVMSF